MMRKTLIFLVAIVFVATLKAQDMPLPIDEQVLIGKLDNGLTYYIRHNAEPKGQANFYIAQKVGSILEEENQRGLAHFLEHMCFNGTEHFPKNRIVEYCESIGVKWGENLNAYTNFDETVYNIDNVPVEKYPSAVDSCLMILRDWAGGLLLNAEDIDKERGVIHEEWRMRSNAQMRMFEQILPKLYPNNRYGERLPIGKMEVVDNFPHKDLRDYYHKWYRPDEQGIIVVGDIDVKQIEEKIKALFSKNKMPENPAPRTYFEIEDNKEPIVIMATDKEQAYSLSLLMCKHDAFDVEARLGMNYYVYLYATRAISQMLNQRMQEVVQKKEPPFAQCFTMDGDFLIAKTKKAFSAYVISSENQIKTAIAAAYRELLRAKRHGFTPSEYERAKADILSDVESALKSVEQKKSGDYCWEYVRHFIDREPIVGAKNDLQLTQQISGVITVDMINQLLGQLISNENLAVCMMVPQKEDVQYPSTEEIKQTILEVSKENITAYEEKLSNEPLMKELPKAGKVISKKPWKMGYTQLTLSNGVKVYYLPTDYNKDEVIVRGTSLGGASLYTEKDYANLKVVDEIMQIGGVGNFSKTDLQKVLAGKKAYLTLHIGKCTEEIYGNTTPKDLETLLQLNYLNLTALRADEDAFQSWRTRSLDMVKNREKDPMSSLQDSIKTAIFRNSRAHMDLRSEDFEQISYSRSLEIARERFENAGDFTYFITGAIDEKTLVPLLERYLASLPVSKQKDKAKSSIMEFNKGRHNHIFERELKVPMTTNVFFYNAKARLDVKQMLSHELAMSALNVVLNAEIREKEGGTYSIGAYADRPQDLAMIARRDMTIVYQTNPEKYEYLNKRVMEIVEHMAKNGPKEEDVKKGKEFLLKKFKENLRDNYFWSNSAIETFMYGKDLTLDYEKILENITSEDIRREFESFLKEGNLGTVILIGKKAQEN
ncbi:MAG: insulinase family protein [Alistipes sp.]|nr:insulinase family protein [Candidatus Alistipes equi]